MAVLRADVTAGPGPGTYDLDTIIANMETGGMVWGTALMKVSGIVTAPGTLAAS